VEYGKVSHDHHRVTKGVTKVTEMLCHIRVTVTVTECDKEVS